MEKMDKLDHVGIILFNNGLFKFWWKSDTFRIHHSSISIGMQPVSLSFKIYERQPSPRRTVRTVCSSLTIGAYGERVIVYWQQLRWYFIAGIIM